MEERWFCNECCREFAEPSRYYTQNDSYSATVNYACPYCASSDVEEMKMCPTCDGGWMRKESHVCEKCHLRNLNDLHMFVRKYSKFTLADMDDIIEGESLESFR